MTLIEINVTFDFVCAWCYIGKRTLDRAISLYRKTYPGGRNDTITITWRPYYLNYNPHGHSVPKADLIDERLHDQTPDQRTALVNRMNKIGQSVGIYFKGGGMIGPHTRDAHRLVYLTRGSSSPETQGGLVEKILEAYHEREMDISDPAVLKEVAEMAGVEGKVLELWLAGGQSGGGDEVDEEARRNKEMMMMQMEGKRGVPRFVIQGEYEWDGQDVYEFMEIMGKVKEKED
ncbi:hypothetical protein FE257_010723 [Aspergillus nanangensis]|uniref:DSBA-like thioredoxin domain-containing protein n=1 Tax=Aspergillus nanangensis TaxID=2582783 RepID=A0AAD4CJY7_ASPNN|nr:hypothetical protein FE257_010723 [Aspergillus nanangensis]